MKEIHNTTFRPVLARVLVAISGPLFILGLIITAIMRMFFLGSDETFLLLAGVFLFPAMLWVVAHRLDKKSIEQEAQQEENI